jgi:hypothetical protein
MALVISAKVQLVSIFGPPEVSPGSVEQVFHMIEHIFKNRELDPHEHQVDSQQPGAWWLSEQDSIIYIYVHETTTGPTLRVTSPILNLPAANREQFYRRLLDLNTDLSSCGLATYKDIVLVVAQRHTDGLTEQELDDIVSNTGFVGTTVAAKLRSEFGAAAYTVPSR